MHCTVLQCPRMASGRRWTVAVLVGRWDYKQEVWSTEQQQGSQGPLGEEISQWGWADGVLNESALRQVDGCHPRFTIASKQVASPSSSSPHGSPSDGTASPGPHPIIYTLYAHTHLCWHTDTHTSMAFILRTAQSSPAPGHWTRKQSRSRLNPGVSFPLRSSSHSQPPPSDFGHNTEGIVIKFQTTFSLPLQILRCTGSILDVCLWNNYLATRCLQHLQIFHWWFLPYIIALLLPWL